MSHSRTTTDLEPQSRPRWWWSRPRLFRHRAGVWDLLWLGQLNPLELRTLARQSRIPRLEGWTTPRWRGVRFGPPPRS